MDAVNHLRESIGIQTDTVSDDFKKVDAAFERNIAELKAAGAVIVDPIVIPDLKPLLAKRTRNPVETDALTPSCTSRSSSNRPSSRMESTRRTPTIAACRP